MSFTKSTFIVFKTLLISLSLLGLPFLTSCDNKDNQAKPALNFNPGSWDKLNNFVGPPRSKSVSFVIGNFAYVGTGYNIVDKSFLKDFWRYDPSNDSWLRIADLPGDGRHSAVAFVLNNKAYVGTGTSDGINGLSDFYEFDPAGAQNGKWTQIKDFIDSRYGAVAFSVKNRAFVTTGVQVKDSVSLNDLWEYDQLNDTWTERPALAGEARRYAFAMTIKDFVYLGGGQRNEKSMPSNIIDNPLNDFYRLDVDAIDTGSAWTSLGYGPNSPRAMSSTFSIGNSGFLACGAFHVDAYNNPLFDTWGFDPSEPKWQEYFTFYFNTPQGQARMSAVAFAIGNYGYLALGNNGSLDFKDVWKFDPNGIEPNNK